MPLPLPDVSPKVADGAGGHAQFLPVADDPARDGLHAQGVFAWWTSVAVVAGGVWIWFRAWRAGVADTFVLGLRGDASDLAGVALGAAIFNIVYWSVYFLRMGTTGLTAQANGSDDEAEVQRTLLRALILAGGIGLLVWLVRAPLADIGFAILQGGPEAEADGTAYFTARS